MANILFGSPQYKVWIPLLKKIKNSSIADFKSEDDLEELIRQKDIKIIIPCSFVQMKFLATLNRSDEYEILSCDDYKSVEICNDKTKFAEFMQHNNFGDYVPKRYTLKNVKFPAIFKYSITSSGIGSEICYNMDDLKRKIKTKRKYVIQEFVVSKNEYAGNMFVKNGEIIHSIYYTKKYEQKYYIQRGSMFNQKGTYKRIDETKMRRHEENTFSKILKKLNFTGFLCFDFKIVDDEVKIFEINPRLGGTLIRTHSHFVEMLNAVINNLNLAGTNPLEKRLKLLEKEVDSLRKQLENQN